MNRILCVDDDEGMRNVLKDTLTMEYEVFTAADPEEGLKLFQEKGPFSIVISDMRMPGMDGTKFLLKIRDIDSDPARILLTAHSDLDDDVIDMSNIFRILNKPYNMQDLFSIVTAGIDHCTMIRSKRELRNKLN